MRASGLCFAFDQLAGFAPESDLTARAQRSGVAVQVLDRSPVALEVMLHQPDVMEVILFLLKFAIWIDVEGVAGKALEQIGAIIGVDNPFEAFRHMMQRRSWLVCIPDLMKTQVDVLQQVCPHVAVQKHEGVGWRLRDCEAHLVFRRQVGAILVAAIFSHHIAPTRDFAPMPMCR